jgi:hypothetical protein
MVQEQEYIEVIIIRKSTRILAPDGEIRGSPALYTMHGFVDRIKHQAYTQPGRGVHVSRVLRIDFSTTSPIDPGGVIPLERGDI